ncbi:MAG TPA: rhomboid family intramembrane serine protease GlpG [Pseudomonadales bacterium]
MIELVSFNHLRAAQALVDYLNVQKISAKINKHENSYLVFIENEETFGQAASILEEFLNDPNNEKFRRASWESTAGHYIEENKPYRSSSLLQDIFSRSGIVTITVTVICLGVYALMSVKDPEQIFQLLSFPHLGETELRSIEFFKFLTPIFLHFSIPHLIFNLLWWWVYGGQIERLHSSTHLVLLTLSIGLLSNIAQYLTSGPNFGGLSGVVYGVLAYCWVWGKVRPQDQVFLPNSLFNFMLVWLLIGYTGVLDSVMGKMANAAHLGGLLSGLLLGLIFTSRKRS